MANPGYVRSTDGSDADNGSTWALANATLGGAMADQVAGDVVYVSQAHAESAAAAKTITLPGTVASPNKVIGGNDAAQPPTTISNAPSVTTTGANAITINGCGYFRGLTFNSGSGSNNITSIFGGADGDRQHYFNCFLYLVSTHSSARQRIGPTAAGAEAQVVFQDCEFRGANAAHALRIGNARVEILDGIWASGGTAPTVFIEANPNTNAFITIDGIVLSNLATAVNLFSILSGTLRAVIRNCALPTSWSGSLITGTITTGSRVEMYNCDSGDTNYRVWIEDQFGSIKSETTIVRTGGASDGTTPISYKMVSGADAEFPHQCLVSQDIYVWRDTTGGTTFTVEIVNDGVTLDTDDIGLEVVTPQGSSAPRYGHTRTQRGFLSSASNHASSSETWTTTGLSSPVKQSIATGSISLAEKGWVIIRVLLYRASTTVYVCPKVTVA